MATSPVFIDHGYPDGEDFLLAFLGSGDFLRNTLSSLSNLRGNKNKREHALEIINRLNLGNNSYQDILSAWVNQQRTYLTFRLIQNSPNHINSTNFNDPTELLTSFGEDGWYGPIFGNQNNVFYVRILRVETRNIDNRFDENLSNYRWSVIAEFRDGCLFFSWNNFGYVSPAEEFEGNPNRKEFAYWDYIDDFYEELRGLFFIQFNHVDFGHLILTTIWERFYEDIDFRWDHIAISANSAGVAFNARSAVRDINLQGIRRLSEEITRTALSALNHPFTERDRNFLHVDSQIINFLIRDWEPRSYEFQLSQDNKILFKAHCYFGYSLLDGGLNPRVNQKRDLPHFHCYFNSNGTRGIIDFFLNNNLLDLS
ncbi:hypothetical protein NON20_17125 [Synechocystis sp. B12]|nr:hypothetical protein NON20_17125 [Synechocystis sp. B12]